MLTGVLASAGLFVYALLQRRSFDPWEMFAMTVAGSMTTLGVAGWMIGRRDDALERRNEDLRALSERLQGLSATDALSGIANRRTFDERLAVEVARANRYGAPLSLVMIDLDHFKELNDTFGHPAGDEVLKRVAGPDRSGEAPGGRGRSLRRRGVRGHPPPHRAPLGHDLGRAGATLDRGHRGAVGGGRAERDCLVRGGGGRP
jgi:hypothetical protein